MIDKRLREILEELLPAEFDEKGKVLPVWESSNYSLLPKYISQIKALIISELDITPLILANRPGELHWGIYIGEFETKEEAVEKLKKKLEGVN